jgi:aquaporin TIP
MDDAYRRAAAEFVGTFALIFVGAGAVMTAVGLQDPASTVGVALAHGLTIAVMCSAVGHISGGHFNPAVTFGFLITRRMDPMLAGIYWLAQFAAAILGALLLKWIFPDSGAVDQANLGAPLLNEQIGVSRGLVLEAILTFFLVWVIFATAADPRGAFKSIAGLAIGLTITVDILIAGPLTGAVMNPARSIGPQLISGEWSDFWLWIVGPLVGGAAAALAYDRLYLRPVRPAPVGPPDTGLEEPRPGDTALS